MEVASRLEKGKTREIHVLVGHVRDRGIQRLLKGRVGSFMKGGGQTHCPDGGIQKAAPSTKRKKASNPRRNCPQAIGARNQTEGIMVAADAGVTAGSSSANKESASDVMFLFVVCWGVVTSG